MKVGGIANLQLQFFFLTPTDKVKVGGIAITIFCLCHFQIKKGNTLKYGVTKLNCQKDREISDTQG